MTASQPSSAVSAWRVAVIGLVGALAVGIGLAVGSFLLQNRVAPIGSGASYVPASAPLYFEVRLEPSTSQDASLRELLGRFPAIEGLDLSRPLYEQLTEKIDEAAEADAELSWSEDVAPWFDGRIGLAILDVPVEAFAPTDVTAMPPMPSMVALFGVEDRAEAEAAIGRVLAEADDEVTFTEQVHAGVSIQVADEGAYALTDDQLLVAPAADDIVAALDAHASSETTLFEADSITRLTDALPEEWLLFGIFDFTDVVAAAFDSPAASPGADMFRELFENQPMRGAMALTAAGDRITVESVTEPPTGPLAVSNADRGLADEVPGDALYYAEGGNTGQTLNAVIGPLKETLAEVPGGQEQLDMVESALGGEVEELVAWMGDAATVAGFDGEQIWGGVVIVPTDADAARDTMSQLSTFANLAALDPSIGITVEERELDGETLTSLRWADPNVEPGGAPVPGMPAGPPEIVVEWLVSDDRVLIGVGDRFVERVHGQEAAGSLAETPRYRDAVAELGGPESVAVMWVDLRGVVSALETAFAGEDMSTAGDLTSVMEWLAPLDRVVSVSRLEGEVLVADVVLLVE